MAPAQIATLKAKLNAGQLLSNAETLQLKTAHTLQKYFNLQRLSDDSCLISQERPPRDYLTDQLQLRIIMMLTKLAQKSD